MISSLERSSSSAVLGSGAGSVGASSSLKSDFVFHFVSSFFAYLTKARRICSCSPFSS